MIKIDTDVFFFKEKSIIKIFKVGKNVTSYRESLLAEMEQNNKQLLIWETIEIVKFTCQ